MDPPPPLSGSQIVLDLSIHYATTWGQQIGVVGSHPSLGGGDPAAAPMLAYEAGGVWRGRVVLPAPCVLRYRYFLLDGGGRVETEWGEERELDLRHTVTARADDPAAAAQPPPHVELREAWRAPGILAGLFHPVMARYMWHREAPGNAGARAACRQGGGGGAAALQPSATTPTDTAAAAALSRRSDPRCRSVRVRFLLHEPRVPAGAAVAVVGSAPALGGWRPDAAPRMSAERYPLWSLEVDLPSNALPLEYKFAVVALAGGGGGAEGAAATPAAPPAPARLPPPPPYGWEDGDNRRLEAPSFVRLGDLSAGERALVAAELLRARGGGLGGGAADGRPALAGDDDPLADFSCDTWVRRPVAPAELLPEAARVEGGGSSSGGGGGEGSPLSSPGHPRLVDVEPLGKPGVDGASHDGGGHPPDPPLSPGAVTAGGMGGGASRPHSRDGGGGSRGSGSGGGGGVPLLLGAPPPHLHQQQPPAAASWPGAAPTPLDVPSPTAARPPSPPLLRPPPPRPLLVAHAFLARMDARPWRAAAVSVPLFSLRSAGGLGTGEFPDVAALADWAADVGLRSVRLLPVWDTSCAGGPDDSNPYRPSSAFALHPLYVSLQALARSAALGRWGDFSLGPAADGTPICARLPAGFAAAVDTARAQLEGGSGGGGGGAGRAPALDYPAVMAAKLGLLREAFRAVGALTLGSPGFARWFRANRAWVQPHAAHRLLAGLHGTPDPARWGARRAASRAQVQSLCDPAQLHHPAVAFHFFVQYAAHVQLAAASAHAAARGVLLAVDLPHALPRGGADAWAQPGLFRLGRAVGAPPDGGGRPLGDVTDAAPYAWPALVGGAERTSGGSGSGGDSNNDEEEGPGGAREGVAAWWARRLRHAGAYFPCVRLAGVEGFFRAYELPATAVSGLGGVFAPHDAGFTVEELAAAGALGGRGAAAAAAPGAGGGAASGGEATPPPPQPAAAAATATALGRLTQPYIREWTARAALGPGYASVVPRFFDIDPATGGYAFKPHLAADERALAAAVATAESGSGGDGGEASAPHAGAPPPPPPPPSSTLGGLLRLRGNVCLVRTQPDDAGGAPARYHPATDMQASTSFLELPEPARAALGSLYALYYGARAPAAWRADGRARLGGLQAAAPGVLLHCDDAVPRPGITDVLYALGVPGARHCPPTGAGLLLATSTTAGAPEHHPPPCDEYGCVAAPSTPDTPTLRGRWEEDPALSARVYYGALGGAPASQPPAVCTPQVAGGLLALAARAPAMWAEFQLADLLAADGALRGGDPHGERLNVPSVRRHVWRWRARAGVEELGGGAGRGLTAQLRGVLAATGRL